MRSNFVIRAGMRNPVFAPAAQPQCGALHLRPRGRSGPLGVTADFVYLRAHGTSGRYEGSYVHKTLGVGETTIGEWRKSEAQRLRVISTTTSRALPRRMQRDPAALSDR